MNTTNDTPRRKRYAAPAMEVLSVRTERLMTITASADDFHWASKGYTDFDDEDEGSGTDYDE